MAEVVPDSPRETLRKSLLDGATFEARVRRAIAAAVLAPSIHNTQPWTFRFQPDPWAIELWADRSRLLPVVDPQGRQLIMSCGTALVNLQVELLAQGFGVRTEMLPSQPIGRHIASVRLTDSITDRDRTQAELATAINGRFTARAAFKPGQVSDHLLDELVAAAAREDVECRIVTPTQVDEVARLTRRGHRSQLVDAGLRRELLTWTRPRDVPAVDGVIAEAFGRDSTVNYSAAVPQRDFAQGRDVLESGALNVDADITLAVLATDTDEPTAWLRAGMGLERVLLTAAKHGVMASYLNQSIEVASLRPRLRDAVGLTGFPQLVLRLGFPSEGHQPVSPRRPAQDFFRGTIPPCSIVPGDERR